MGTSPPPPPPPPRASSAAISRRETRAQPTSHRGLVGVGHWRRWSSTKTSSRRRLEQRAPSRRRASSSVGAQPARAARRGPFSARFNYPGAAARWPRAWPARLPLAARLRRPSTMSSRIATAGVVPPSRRRSPRCSAELRSSRTVLRFVPRRRRAYIILDEDDSTRPRGTRPRVPPCPPSPHRCCEILAVQLSDGERLHAVRARSARGACVLRVHAAPRASSRRRVAGRPPAAQPGAPLRAPRFGAPPRVVEARCGVRLRGAAVQGARFHSPPSRYRFQISPPRSTLHGLFISSRVRGRERGDCASSRARACP